MQDVPGEELSAYLAFLQQDGAHVHGQSHQPGVMETREAGDNNSPQDCRKMPLNFKQRASRNMQPQSGPYELTMGTTSDVQTPQRKRGLKRRRSLPEGADEGRAELHPKAGGAVIGDISTVNVEVIEKEPSGTPGHQADDQSLMKWHGSINVLQLASSSQHNFVLDHPECHEAVVPHMLGVGPQRREIKCLAGSQDLADAVAFAAKAGLHIVDVEHKNTQKCLFCRGDDHTRVNCPVDEYFRGEVSTKKERPSYIRPSYRMIVEEKRRKAQWAVQRNIRRYPTPPYWPKDLPASLIDIIGDVREAADTLVAGEALGNLCSRKDRLIPPEVFLTLGVLLEESLGSTGHPGTTGHE